MKGKSSVTDVLMISRLKGQVLWKGERPSVMQRDTITNVGDTISALEGVQYRGKGEGINTLVGYNSILWGIPFNTVRNIISSVRDIISSVKALIKNAYSLV